MDVPSFIFLISSEQISNAIRAKLISSGILGNDAYVVVAGPANTYAHYVTTIEEYSQQRYEGASTIFGQCELSILPDQFFSGTNCWPVADTLDAYINKYSSLVPYLADDAVGTPTLGAPPVEQTSKALSFQVSWVHNT